VKKISAKKELMLRIYPELADEIGIYESMLLLQLEFWISNSSTDEIDGKRWTYQSTTDMKEKAFNWLSRNTINRMVSSLIDKKLIYVGSFNKSKYDKTRWFALNYDTINTLDSVNLIDNKNGKSVSQSASSVSQNDTGSVQNDTGSVQNSTTIPENTTENKKELKKALCNQVYGVYDKRSTLPVERCKSKDDKIMAFINKYSINTLIETIQGMFKDKWSIENNTSLNRILNSNTREGNIKRFTKQSDKNSIPPPKVDEHDQAFFDRVYKRNESSV